MEWQCNIVVLGWMQILMHFPVVLHTFKRPTDLSFISNCNQRLFVFAPHPPCPATIKVRLQLHSGCSASLYVSIKLTTVSKWLVYVLFSNVNAVKRKHALVFTAAIAGFDCFFAFVLVSFFSPRKIHAHRLMRTGRAHVTLVHIKFISERQFDDRKT